jgi:parallel beta-helix repeat protein
MKSFLSSVFALLALTVAHAGTIPVGPTGTCAGDVNAIQNAVNSAQPRDIVQLAPGSYDFSCLTSDNSPGVFVGNPDVTLQGTPGQTLVGGPGLAAQVFSTAFFVAADGVAFDGIVFHDFFTAIQAGGPSLSANNLAVTNSIFRTNARAITVSQDTISPRIVANQFLVPAPISDDIFSPFGQAWGVIVDRHCSNLLFAQNTITGPGVSAHFQSVDQLVADPRATGIGIRTVGFFQADFSGDIAVLGRVSDNLISGLDVGMQSSSNFGIVTSNVVTNNAIGIDISNDFDDGIHRVSQNVVTENVSTGNQVGIWMASATGNTITLNDLTNNSLAGLLFLANPGGAPSTGNSFHQNKGGLVGAKGNSGF